MTRALLTLVGGIALAVLVAALIAGSRDLGAVMGPILVTTAIGAAVFAVVAYRARVRRAAERLHEEELPTPDPATWPEEPDRG